MQLKTFVKASKINNLSDARYFSAFSVDWMSFDCNPMSDKYLPLPKTKEITQWVSGPKICIDVAGLSLDQIEHLSNEMTIDGIEIEANQIIPENIGHKTVFRKVLMHSNITVEELQTQLKQEADYFTFDFYSSDIEVEPFLQEKQWFLPEIESTKKNVLIEANFNAELIPQLVESNLTGIVIRGGQEEKVGVRSFEDLQDIMDELEV